VLGDPVLRNAIGKRAYAHTRGMVWSSVGVQYRSLFAEVIAAAPATLPVAAPARSMDREPQMANARG
jgi:hypothetical protein